jgi:hypothetical protein
MTQSDISGLNSGRVRLKDLLSEGIKSAEATIYKDDFTSQIKEITPTPFNILEEEVDVTTAAPDSGGETKNSTVRAWLEREKQKIGKRASSIKDNAAVIGAVIEKKLEKISGIVNETIHEEARQKNTPQRLADMLASDDEPEFIPLIEEVTAWEESHDEIFEGTDVADIQQEMADGSPGFQILGTIKISGETGKIIVEKLGDEDAVKVAQKLKEEEIRTQKLLEEKEKLEAEKIKLFMEAYHSQSARFTQVAEAINFLNIGNEPLLITDSIGFVNKALANAIDKILVASTKANSALNALAVAQDNLTQSKEFIICIQKLAGQTMQIADSDVKNLTQEITRLLEEISAKIRNANSGLMESYDIAQEIATLDVADNELAKEKIAKIMQMILQKNQELAMFLKKEGEILI